jgi:hypothetical protein
MLADFLEFLRSVLTHWYTLAAGLAFAVGVFEKVKNRPLRRGLWGFALLFLFFACFQSWRDERGAFLSEQDVAEVTVHGLQTRIAKLSEPLIAGRITQMFAGGATDSSGRQVTEVIEVYLENRGTPTTLRDWQLIIRNDSLNLRATNCVMPEEFDFNTPIGLKGRVDRAHMLQEITMNEIPRGGSRIGWLIFVMPAFDQALITKGTQVIVTAVDAFNHPHVIERTLDVGSVPLTRADTLSFSPGSEQLFTSPSKPTPVALAHLRRHRQH